MKMGSIASCGGLTKHRRFRLCAGICPMISEPSPKSAGKRRDDGRAADQGDRYEPRHRCRSRHPQPTWVYQTAFPYMACVTFHMVFAHQ